MNKDQNEESRKMIHTAIAEQNSALLPDIKIAKKERNKLKNWKN